MKFTFIVIAILALAGGALAAPVDPDSEDGVVSRFVAETKMFALDQDGQIWRHNTGGNTWQPGAIGLPISISEISDWSVSYLTTNSGVTWTCSNALDGGSAAIWAILSAVPSSPVSAESKSLGGLKSQYR